MKNNTIMSTIITQFMGFLMSPKLIIESMIYASRRLRTTPDTAARTANPRTAIKTTVIQFGKFQVRIDSSIWKSP